MVKLTLIARVSDGLPLAEGLDSDKDHELANFKQQAKVSGTPPPVCNAIIDLQMLGGTQARTPLHPDDKSAARHCAVSCLSTLCRLSMQSPTPDSACDSRSGLHDASMLRCRACSRRWRRAGRGSPSA